MKRISFLNIFVFKIIEQTNKNNEYLSRPNHTVSLRSCVFSFWLFARCFTFYMNNVPLIAQTGRVLQQ